jgi:hypothetical protein
MGGKMGTCEGKVSEVYFFHQWLKVLSPLFDISKKKKKKRMK